MKRIAIVGAGGLGVLVADAILARRNGESPEIFFLDDSPTVANQIHGVPVKTGVLSNLQAIEAGGCCDEVIVAVAQNTIRRNLMEALPRLPWANVIHPAATLSNWVQMGIGNIVLGGSVLDPDTIVGNGVFINKLCSIGHNSVLNDFSQLAPRVATGGRSIVGVGTFVGMGAIILPDIVVGDWSVVGAGSVVTRDVANGAVAFGQPARLRGSVPLATNPVPDGTSTLTPMK